MTTSDRTQTSSAFMSLTGASAVARIPVPLVACHLACLGFLMPALAAQVTINAVTKNKIIVTATSSSGSPATNSIPANKDVSTGFRLNAISRGTTGCTGMGSASLTMTKLFGGDNVELYSGAGFIKLGWCYASATSGWNEVRVTFTSPTPVAGRLVITVQGAGDIDVGDDGSVELRAGLVTLDAVVGPKGLPVLLRGVASANTYGSGMYSRSAVLFVPTGGRFQVIGTPCRGPVFEAFYTGTLLRLQASKVPVGKFAFFAIGTQNPNFKIPPLGCTLLTDILIGVGVATNGGEAELRIPVSSPPLGTFRMQFLIASSGGWVTSNALSIKLR